MAFASLYQKYRPGTFAEVIGQDHIVRTLVNAVDHDQVFHAYLFSGPRGTGKTSTARILARALNCENGPTAKPCGECRPCIEIAAGSFPDVFEIDAATHSKVEEAREFLAGVPTGLSAGAKRKFYIVDEVHMLSTHAFNALLKTLEEPPGHVVFVLATTEPHKVPQTVAGRCQQLEFRLVSPHALSEHYLSVCRREGIEAEPAAIEMIARQAGGSVRDGLSLLDQTITAVSDAITVDAVIALTARSDSETVAAIVDAIAARDASRCFKLLADLVNEGRDIRHFTSEMIRYFRSMLVTHLAPGAAGLVEIDESSRARLQAQADLLGEATLLRAIELCGNVISDAASGADVRISLETALVRMAHPEADATPAALAQRIEKLELVIGEGAGGNLPAAPAAGAGEALAVQPSGSHANEESTPGEPEKEPVQSGTDTGQAAQTSTGKSPQPRADIAATDAPKPADESSPTTAGRQGVLDFDYLLRLWPEVLEALRDRRKKRLHALVAEGRPITLEGNELVIGFGAKHEYHAKSLMDNASDFEEILREILRAPLRIRSQIVEAPSPDGPAGSKHADTGRQVAATIAPNANASATDGDTPSSPSDTSQVGVVDLVKQLFGAEVVEEYRSE